MTGFLVVSDTHGNVAKLEAALSAQFEFDEKFRPRHLIHLGDGLEDLEKCDLSEKFCLHCVSGNCDSRFYSLSEPSVRLLEFDGCKLLITHGHTFNVKLSVGQAVAYADTLGADIVMFGHTHTPVSYVIQKGNEVCGKETTRDITVFNPGSLGRGGSFGIVEICNGHVVTSHTTVK